MSRSLGRAGRAAACAFGTGLALVLAVSVAHAAPADAPEQAFANFVPAPDAVAATGVGVGQPVVVQFTAPVQDRAEAVAHLQVTTTPPQPGAWYWVDDRDVHYRAAQYWTPGTTITVHAGVAGVDLGGGVTGAEDHDATYRVHDAWVAKADGATKKMQVLHNGTVVRTMAISMGKAATPTHVGAHVVSEKDQKVEMNSCSYGVCQGQPGYYDVTEQWAERISQDGEFVHENAATVAQQGAANVSHGCINLGPADAQWFFRTFGLGDVVEVAGSGGQPLPVADLYGDWAVPWSTWQAGN